jgi:hypothetical protein
MEEIKIEATEKSPRVYFDPENRKFELEGNSRPENVREFFYPIIDKLREYFEDIINNGVDDNQNNPVKFVFQLEYFNSSSAKFISDILILIGNYHKKGMPVKIYWYFDEGDEDMMEVGEDFSEMIDIPFQMIMVSQ